MSKKKLTYIKTESLVPYARNSRTHSDEQISQIMASIKEFGFTNPLLVDGDNGIVAGHGRLQAAQRLGMDEVPCLVLDHLSEAQKKALVIADNKLALNAGWDMDMLAVEFKDLDELNFDLTLTGFGKEELYDVFLEPNFAEEPEDYKEITDEQKNIILVELKNENDCEVLYDELQERGYECKLMS